jgi:phospholipid/cholesterol/gamma-HCH transport system permease protein
MTPAQLILNDDSHIQLCGAWTLSGIASLQIDHIIIPSAPFITLEGQDIAALDSGGAWLLQRFIQRLQQHHKETQLTGFKQQHNELMQLIATQAASVEKDINPKIVKKKLLQRIGETTVKKAGQGLEFITFLGEVVVNIIHAFCRPRLIRVKAFLNVIDEAGFQALGIVALLTFLIGIVLAYQMGQQLKIYGANIFIVSISGMAILQEFAPLITAIIVAGRTSSAFTAQIGTMKINEEIDALRTMGLSPFHWLILPKVFGLIIALPLLIVWADMFGLIGSMVMSKTMLGVSYYDFITRLPKVITLSTFINGVIKAPIFALLISTVGCFQGLKVGSSADSVGKQTTKSVVQAIFLIIIADAIFSILMGWQGVS